VDIHAHSFGILELYLEIGRTDDGEELK